MKSLTSLFLNKKFDTDKYNLGYLDNYYDNFFDKYNDKDITMLEIGTKRGGSIELWKAFLSPKSSIYGADITPPPKFRDKNLIIGDMYSQKMCNKLKDDKFDLIIDDGPHTLESFIYLIINYHKKVKEGGFLIVEDIIHKKWVPLLQDIAKVVGYSSIKVIDMTGKQKNRKLLNKWRNGLYILELQR